LITNRELRATYHEPLTMVSSMKDPRQALTVCRQIERQSASQPGNRLRCFPALAPR
jgi:hypothetical protein